MLRIERSRNAMNGTGNGLKRVESSFFEDRSLFPAGSVEFDCALVMRGIDHEWHGQETLCLACAG
jgi:hypothetical protein